MPLKSSSCWCIVPSCKNTSISTPNKVFINVPAKSLKRKSWLDACGNKNNYSTSSRLYCCEDHFDLKSDMENWLEWKMMGGNKRMKKDVVPHKFIHQSKPREIDNSPMEFHEQESPMEFFEKLVSNMNDTVMDENHNSNIDSMDLEYIDRRLPSSCDTVETSSIIDDDDSPILHQKVNAAVQVKLRSHYRSVQVQCEPKTQDRATSPIEILVEKNENNNPDSAPSKSSDKLTDVSNTTISSYTTTSDKVLPSNGSTENEWKNQLQREEFERLNLKQTMAKIRQSPRKYIGIPNDCIDILDILQTTDLRDVEIFVTLKKIRLNESFAILADDFGMSVSNVSRTFTKTLPIIAEYLKDFIIWPCSLKIKQQLPMSFRSRYAMVESIIDCLEIEIEKPTDPVRQALTWSEYKKCNTLKYLISCTPDGIINFISPGFGGRTSDAEIVSSSGYLSHLRPGVAVLADRGFKHIENSVIAKGCTLIRPPTVSSDKKPTHDEVIATKRIASLRIHVERLIRRIREFHICEPHSCINIKLIPQMDDIITIVAALTNLQGPLIRKT